MGRSVFFKGRHNQGIAKGALLGLGIGYSVMAPAVVMLPIWPALDSVNHSAPSGPEVIPRGPLLGVGTTIL